MGHNIISDLKEKTFNKLTLKDASIEELIIAGFKSMEYKEIILSDNSKLTSIPNKQKTLYTRFMKVLAMKANQDMHTRFKIEKGIDFIPAYVTYNVSKKSAKIEPNYNFLKLKLKAEIDMYDWLLSNRSNKLGIKNKRKKATQLKKWLDVTDGGGSGTTHNKFNTPMEVKRPRWYKDVWKIWADKYFVKEFSLSNSGGKNIFTSSSNIENKFHITKDDGIQKYREIFSSPIQSESLKKALDPDNFDELFGDGNTKTYIKRYDVNEKLYKKIMNKVLSSYWEAVQNIDARMLTLEDVENLESSYQPNFPNIKKIRTWFVNKGMKNSTNKNHKYTTEKFLNLKSNSARANFIDRAVFLIANSIYLKNHIPSKRSRFNNNNVIQSAGKKNTNKSC